MSVFHQHSHSISKYYSRMIFLSGLKRSCLQWRIWPSTIRYRINISNVNINKSKQPVPPCFLQSVDCSYVTYATHIGTLYQSSQFVCGHLFLSSLLHFCLRLPAQISGPYSSHEAPPLSPQHLMPLKRPGTGY